MEYFVYVRCVGHKNHDDRWDITEGRYFLGEKPEGAPGTIWDWPLQQKAYVRTQAQFELDHGYFPEDTGLGIIPFIEGVDNVEVSWP